MCRLALYMGPEISLSSLVTEPSHSIIKQSFRSREREEPLNGDGFGVAWYAGNVSRQPAVFKEISPAWSNANLLSLAPVVKSGCILAHVRAATVGLPVTQTNCHPFSWKNLSMMHNGEIAGFANIRRELRRSLSDQSYQWLQGTTDSEHLFAYFLDRFSEVPESTPEIDRMTQALIETIRRLEVLRFASGEERESYLNLVVSNGQTAVVSRFSSNGTSPNTLYVNTGNGYVCSDGECKMLQSGQAAVLVASEPLSTDDGWRAVPANHVMQVKANRSVAYQPIEA